ncbi:MAG: PHP domain-containing protein [Candidatus Parcubacteria bacterium]|nr:PHP domain-containing protein [Candidatus Parcubacteria bacterium]
MNIDKDKLFFNAGEIKDLPLIEQHLHTNFSDGDNSPREIINCAIEKKAWRVAFTEHVRKNSDWYKYFIKEIRELKEIYKDKLIILTGLEAKLINLDGEIDATEEQISQAEIPIGSVHAYCKEGPGNRFYEFEELEYKEALEMDLKCTLKLIENAKNSGIKVIGHPFAVYLKYYSKSVPAEYMERIIKKMAANDLAFDFNSHYLTDYFEIILKLCEKHGTKINIGSDVHKLEEFGEIYQILKNKIFKK